MADPNDPNQSAQSTEESAGSGQINIARELNAVLEQVSSRLERIQKLTQSQADFMNQMTQSFNSMQENMESMTGNAQEMSKSFQDAAESAMDQFSKDKLETIEDGVGKITEAYKNASTTQTESLQKASKTVGNMGSLSKTISEDMKKDTNAINKALARNNKSLGKFYNNAGEVNKEVEELSEEVKTLSSRISGFMTSMMEKIKSAMTFGYSAVKNIGSFVFSLIGSVTKFAKFALTVPFTIAKAGANIGNTIRRDIVEVIQTAQEALKEKFDMDSTIGEGIKAMTSRGKGMLLSFQNPSAELVKLFGFGASGISNMIAFLGENVAAMGHFSEMFGRSLGKNMPKFKAFARMVKGFGFSSEDVAYLAQDAAVNLKDINVRMAELGVTLTSTSKEFGLDRKRLSKNFMLLRKDITQFGHLSDEEIARTTARLTQMKVKLEDAAAVFKKFSTFEDAANSVAMLSQTFGMNLDAMDIIQAKNPEDIIEMFRTSMLETGRSFEDLNRFEKELMAQHTGMSAESLKGLMHYRDIGLTYEQARKRMESEKPTAKQMKALKDLNSAIKEVQKVMTFDSPFQAFFKGLSNNVALSSDLRSTLTGLSSGYEMLYKYALNLDPNTWSGLIKPIKLIIDIMSSILKSDAFKGGLVKTMTTIADFAAEMFGATKGDVILSKLETNVSIAMQKGGMFYGKTGKAKQEKFKQILLGELSNQGLSKFVNMKLLEEINNPRTLIQEINKYKQSINPKNTARIKAFDNFTQRSAEELKKQFDKEEELKDNKKKQSKISTSSKGGQARVTEGLTETINMNKNNLGKLASLSFKIAGAVIKGAAIGFTALLKVMNDGMEKVAGSNLGKDTNMIEDLLHFKPGEFEKLGNAIGDAFKDFWENKQSAYSITGWIIDGIKDAFTFVIGGFVDVVKTGINEIMGKQIFEKSASSMLRDSQVKSFKDKSGSMDYGGKAVRDLYESKFKDKELKTESITDLIVALKNKANKVEDKEKKKSILKRVESLENKFSKKGATAENKQNIFKDSAEIFKDLGDEKTFKAIEASQNIELNKKIFQKGWNAVIHNINTSLNDKNKSAGKNAVTGRTYFYKELSDATMNYYDDPRFLEFMSYVASKKEWKRFYNGGKNTADPFKGSIGPGMNLDNNFIKSGFPGFDHPAALDFIKSRKTFNFDSYNKDKKHLYNQKIAPAEPLTVTDTTKSSAPINQPTNDLISDMFMNRMKGMSLLNSNFDIMKNLLSGVQQPTVSDADMSSVEDLNVASYSAGGIYTQSTSIPVQREKKITKEELAQFKEKLMKTKENVAASELEVDSNVIIDTETIMQLMKRMANLGLVNELTKNENTQGVMRLSSSALDSATFNVGNYSATMKETYED